MRKINFPKTILSLPILLRAVNIVFYKVLTPSTMFSAYKCRHLVAPIKPKNRIAKTINFWDPIKNIKEVLGW